MGIVKRIEALDKGRYLVSMEEDSSFPLYKKEVERFGICEGKELAKEQEAQILNELLPRRARVCAMHYLQHMDRTEQQLRRKLSELLYPEDIAEQAVQYVKSYHYIDDVRYAVHYLECRKDRKSLCRLEQELRQKGVSEGDIRVALQQIDVPDEEQQILGWLEKKHYSGEADRGETDRMIRFLLRKGYQMSLIRKVLGTISCEIHEIE